MPLYPPTSSGSSAPVDAQYLTLATNGTLTNERILTPGSGLSGADGGAGSIYTLTANAVSLYGYRGLAMQMVTAGRIQATIEELLLTNNDGGKAIRTTLLAATGITQLYCDMAGGSGFLSSRDTGAESSNTWYHIWVLFKENGHNSTSVTADNSTDTFTTSSAHGMSVGTPLTFAGSLPTGISANTAYYIIAVGSSTTFQVGTTPGAAAVDFTTNGSGVTFTQLPALVFSTSSTSPTLPSDYTHKCYLGAVRNDGSSNFNTFFQVNNNVVGSQNNVFTNQTGVTSWTSQSVSTIVPPTAVLLRGNSGMSTANGKGIAVASNSNGVGMSLNLAASTANALLSFLGQCGPFEITLVTAQTFYWQAFDTNNQYRVDVTGWSY